jgi:hypothetical protein
MDTEVESRMEEHEERQTMTPHEIVSQREWLVARKEEKEKLRHQLICNDVTKIEGQSLNIHKEEFARSF